MKLKKFMVSLLVLSLLSFSILIPANAEDAAIVDPLFLTFDDVDEAHDNFNAIYFLYNIGFVAGYEVKDSEKRIFKPDTSINRAEFSRLVIEGTNKADFVQFSNCFPDVPDDAWYAPYVCLAKENGWISGYPDRTFKPEQTINEAESLKIFGDIIGWEITPASSGEAWYKPYFDYASQKKIAPIEDVGAFMSRGDVAEMIFRNIQLVELNLESYDENFVDDLFLKAGLSFEEADVGSDDVVVDDDSVSDDVNVEIFLDKTSITADGEDSTDVDVVITDEAGNFLENRTVSLTAHTGIDYSKSVFVQEIGEGIYSASFNSKLAGDFSLYVTDQESGEIDIEEVSATPGAFDHIEVIDVVYPYENEDRDKALIKVTGKDVNENVLPYSSVNNNLGAITTMGTSTVTYDENGIFTIEIEADDWGVAYVDIVDKNSGIILSDEDVEFFFFPVQLDMPKAIGADTEQLTVPMYVYFPNSEGELGTYEFDVYYDPLSLTFVNVEDPFPNDNFPTPAIEIDEEYGIIHLTQTNIDPGNSIPSDIQVGALLFDVASTAGGSLSVDGVVLSDTTGQEKNYLGKFIELAEGAADSIEGTAEEIVDALEVVVDQALTKFWMWCYKIKPTKDVCIDAFIYPGSGATQGAVNIDVANVNSIFAMIAKSCNCKFYLNVRVNSVTNLTAAEWGAVDTNRNGGLDLMELNPQVASHPATAGCVPVYYPPTITGGAQGWSWEGSSEGVAVNHSQDKDNRTLAHELAHQLSQGNVRDPGNPPDSTTQGADTAGNLMNYGSTGDTLTVGQCDLIGGSLP